MRALFKWHNAKFFYLFFTTLIFIILLINPQKVTCDAQVYLELGNGLYRNCFNLFRFDFGLRTFLFPLYLSCIILVSNFLHLSQIYLIFFVNLFLFHFSNFLIYKVLKKKDIKIASLFLLLSSFNIINLSFVNVILTESLVVFFVSCLFYLLNFDFVKKPKILFFIGLVASLNVFTRPSNLFLFILIILYVFVKVKFNLKKILIFFIPIVFVFGISSINTYNNENVFSFFTQKTKGIYLMQVQEGYRSLKYETTLDINHPFPKMFYVRKNYDSNLVFNCSSVSKCLFVYFKYDFNNYMVTLFLHLFNLFDRIYFNTYITDIGDISYSLIFLNYFVISSTICFFLFFPRNKKFSLLIRRIFLLIFGTLAIYLPTLVEPRFSSSIFPLLLVLTAIYLYSFLNLFKKRNFIFIRRVFSAQIFIILCFIIISYLMSFNIYFNNVPFFLK